MKKILAVCLAILFFAPSILAQDDEIRRPAIGISFFLDDFETANLIRTTSLNSVFRDKKWAKFKDMNPGLSIHYFKGLTNHLDFAGTLSGSFLRYPFPNKSFSNDKFLLAADAAINFKMLTEKYWVQPYLIAGVGGHMYGKYWGAFMPLGLGLKVNFFDDAHLFVTSQYRVPV